ncbi:hypothetical protein ZWY2020_034022 [Hordeum vulgare]|nr:hypothetical protein ZWY2020_034022 [Hordeum vulgare]
MALLLSPTVSFLALPPSLLLLRSSCPSLPAPPPPPPPPATMSPLTTPRDFSARLPPQSAMFLVPRRCLWLSTPLQRPVTDAAEQPEKPKPAASIEDMPLQSKQQMILEQRARMKVAKKLRQRRRRLVQKRRLRKKGSWPPSKMKKLKNV